MSDQRSCVVDIATTTARGTSGPLLLVFLKHSCLPLHLSACTLVLSENCDEARLLASRASGGTSSHSVSAQHLGADTMKWIPETVHAPVDKRYAVQILFWFVAHAFPLHGADLMYFTPLVFQICTYGPTTRAMGAGSASTGPRGAFLAQLHRAPGDLPMIEPICYSWFARSTCSICNTNVVFRS